MERNPDLLIWWKLPSGMPQCIDGVCTDSDGIKRGIYSGETLEQIGKRYANPVITTIAEYHQAHEAAYSRPPARTTESHFIEMLEILPPLDWHHERGRECFKMCERLSGCMTNIFVRTGAEYWTFVGRDDMTPAAIFAAVDAVKESGA